MGCEKPIFMTNDILGTKFTIKSLFGVDRGDHKHTGLDVYTAEGKVFSTVNGVIMHDQFSDTFGNWISIYDPIEDLLHRYGHFKTRSVFDVGNEVQVGNFVGFQGNTGRSTGEHIHYDIVKMKGADPKALNVKNLKLEDYLDPLIYLGIEGAQLGQQFSIQKTAKFCVAKGYSMEMVVKRLK